MPSPPSFTRTFGRSANLCIPLSHSHSTSVWRSLYSPTPIGEPRSNTSPQAYMGMVDKAKEYIAAGDIFQVVLSQRFEAPFSLAPFSLYRALRRVNPAPFLYFLDFGGYAVAGMLMNLL